MCVCVCVCVCVPSWINQTLTSNLDVQYFIRLYFIELLKGIQPTYTSELSTH